MENNLKRIKEINEQLPKILTSDFYGTKYFCSNTCISTGEEYGIEALYIMFLAEMNRLISVNNAYSAIASSCENGKIWSLFSISCSPEHYRADISWQRTMRERRIGLGSIHYKEVKPPTYVVPVGLCVTTADSQARSYTRWTRGWNNDADLNSMTSQSLVKTFRDFVRGNNQSDLNKFKISFNEWYQTFVQGVLQKSEYFQTPELMTLASRIWNRYCDYIESRESDVLKQSIKDVQALIDERSRLVLEYREADKQNKIKISQVAFTGCALFCVALFVYFSHIVALILCGLFAWGSLFVCWDIIRTAKDTNVSEKYVSIEWWKSAIDRYPYKHHTCHWH